MILIQPLTKGCIGEYILIFVITVSLKGGHWEVWEGLQRDQERVPALEVYEEYYWVFLYVEDNR